MPILIGLFTCMLCMVCRCCEQGGAADDGDEGDEGEEEGDEGEEEGYEEAEPGVELILVSTLSLDSLAALHSSSTALVAGVLLQPFSTGSSFHGHCQHTPACRTQQQCAAAACTCPCTCAAQQPIRCSLRPCTF